MKRKVPVGSLDQFFSIQKEKKPVSLDSVIPVNRAQLSVVKSQSQKNTPHITIPSLSDQTSNVDEKCAAKISLLKEGIHQIFKDSGKVNFAQLFNDTEYVCRNKTGEVLYKEIFPDLEEISKDFISSIPSEFDISTISKIVNIFEENLCDFQKVFLFLDRTYVYERRIDGFTSLIEVVHELVRKALPNELCDSITEAMLQNIIAFRCDKEEVNKDSLKTCLLFAKQCKFYLKPFEGAFLLQTKDYFDGVAADLDLMKLISWAQVAKDKEEALFNCGMEKGTYDSVKSMFDEICLQKTGDRILGSSEYAELIEHEDFETLRKIAKLFEGEELRKIVFKHFSKYWGDAISSVFDLPKKEWIAKLLDIAFAGVMATSKTFNLSKEASTAVKDAMRNAIKSKEKKDMVETILAKYIDSGNDFDNKVLNLFRLIEASECFETSYSYTLKKRIVAWNVNPGRERKIISILEKEKNRDYTKRLHELLDNYSSSLMIQQPRSDEIDYRCLWLHSANWIVEDTQPVFPEEIERLNSKFALQQIKKEGEKAFFSAALSSAVVQFGEAAIKMGGEEAIILIELQKHALSVDELSKALRMNDKNIECNLVILEDNKYVVKQENEKYAINPDLNLPAGNYELPSAKMAGAKAKPIYIQERVNEYRENILKSKIMLIIKEFKTLKLQDILQKVKKEISFTPDQNMFLEVIKFLTSRDFIQERSPGTYCYN